MSSPRRYIPKYKTLTFFGDSITVGAFDKEGMLGWVGRLSGMFAKNSRYNAEYIFQNNATCGNTTADTLADVKSSAGKGLPPNLVIVQSGLNDTIIFGGTDRKRCKLSHTQRMQAWACILNIAAKKKWPVLVVGLPGVQGDKVEIETKDGKTAYRIEMKEIVKYNDALGGLCAKRDVPFLDVAPEWRKNEGKGLFATDGFHLNSRGHQLLAREVFKYIDQEVPGLKHDL